jgi:hypothetical protein
LVAVTSLMTPMKWVVRAVLVVHRGDVQVVPEQLAVLAQVAQHHVDRPVRRDRLAQLVALACCPCRARP